MGIRDNYNSILELAVTAAQKAGRDTESVKIISVSKTFPFEIIQEAIDTGIMLFGENKVQEAKSKISRLTGNCSFHFIGHLQSNKVKDAVAMFDLIHSVDSLDLAKRIDTEASKIGKVQQVLIQVNASEEKTKSGTGKDDAIALAADCLDLKHIELAGFMSIGPLTDDKMLIQKSFAETRKILETANVQLGTSLKELSMGMSGDFEIAIAEGATMIRIGSSIFGHRDYK